MPDRPKTYTIRSHEGFSHTEVIEDEHGQWMYFSDHEKALTQRDEELRERIEQVDGKLKTVAETAITWASKVKLLTEAREQLDSIFEEVDDECQ